MDGLKRAICTSATAVLALLSRFSNSPRMAFRSVSQSSYHLNRAKRLNK